MVNNRNKIVGEFLGKGTRSLSVLHLTILREILQTGEITKKRREYLITLCLDLDYDDLVKFITILT